VFVGAGYTAGGPLRDIDTGYLQRLRLLPVHPIAVLTGKVAFEAVRGTVTAIAALAAAVALGADTVGVGWLALLVALATGLAVAWNGICYLTALTTRTHASVLGLQPLFMPVIMFSTFWVPTTFMPGWYRTIATWNPFNPIPVRRPLRPPRHRQPARPRHRHLRPPRAGRPHLHTRHPPLHPTGPHRMTP
jgi:ABC-2 type transport system permease protein